MELLHLVIREVRAQHLFQIDHDTFQIIPGLGFMYFVSSRSHYLFIERSTWFTLAGDPAQALCYLCNWMLEAHHSYQVIRCSFSPVSIRNRGPSHILSLLLAPGPIGSGSRSISSFLIV